MFENFPNKKQEEKDVKKSTIFKKIRDSKYTTPILKAIVTAELIGLGTGTVIKKDKEEKQEIEKEKGKAKEYYMEKNDSNIDNAKDFLNDDFISYVALNNRYNSDLGLSSIHGKEEYENRRDSINKKGVTSDEDREQLKELNEEIEFYDSEINKDKKKLTHKDKEDARQQIINIITIIENAKLELIKHIQSHEYLEKLASEMNISEEVAKEHQKVRTNNVLNLRYELESAFNIQTRLGRPAEAYFSSRDEKIVIPFDVDMRDEKEKRQFWETIRHELLHGSTQANKGLSDKAEHVFKESFASEKIDTTGDIGMLTVSPKVELMYYSNPAELIVRKQILDLDMEKLGIKKYGEKFTDTHYKKLLELKEKGKLSGNVLELLEYIKPEKFSEVMNELAENKGSKNYYHPAWDYSDTGDSKA